MLLPGKSDLLGDVGKVESNSLSTSPFFEIDEYLPVEIAKSNSLMVDHNDINLPELNNDPTPSLEIALE